MYKTVSQVIFTEVKLYKVVQIWPGRFVCKQVTVCPGHIWTTLYNSNSSKNRAVRTELCAVFDVAVASGFDHPQRSTAVGNDE
jgi:hypothetical protein